MRGMWCALFCSCAQGIKTGLGTEQWHALLHLNSPPCSISWQNPLQSNTVNLVKSHTVHITKPSKPGDLFQTWTLYLKSIDLPKWTNVDGCRLVTAGTMQLLWLQLTHFQYFNLLLQTAWQLPPVKQPWCTMMLSCGGRGVYHCAPFGEESSLVGKVTVRWLQEVSQTLDRLNISQNNICWSVLFFNIP